MLNSNPDVMYPFFVAITKRIACEDKTEKLSFFEQLISEFIYQ